MALEFSFYRPEFRDGVLALQRFLWGPHRDLNSAYLHWKHGQNPFVEGPLISMVFSGGKAVGMRGFMGTSWEGGDGQAPVVIPMAGDLVIHPDHRSTGIVRRLMEYSLGELRGRGYRLVMNMSGSRFTQLSSMRMGWKAAIRCRVARWTNTSFRERKVLGAPKRFLEVKLAEKNGHPFGVLDRRASRLSSWSVSVRASPRPSDMAGLIGRIPWDGRVRQRRDESYLAWRFLNPRSAYRFFYHGKEDLQGYLVLEGKRRRTEMEARILDWEATTEEVAWDLLDAAVRMSGLKHLSTWANSLAPRRAEMLRASGFEEVDEEQERERAVNPAVLVKSLVDDDEAGEADPFGVDLTRELNWDVRPLYSDAG